MQKANKFVQVTWPGKDNLDEYSWVDEEGNLHLKSIDDDLCELILSQNNLHFRVMFLHLLPQKKATWTMTDPNVAASTFDDAMSASAYGRSQMSQISNQYGGTRTMKMMFEYARVE